MVGGCGGNTVRLPVDRCLPTLERWHPMPRPIRRNNRLTLTLTISLIFVRVEIKRVCCCGDDTGRLCQDSAMTEIPILFFVLIIVNVTDETPPGVPENDTASQGAYRRIRNHRNR